MACRQSRLDLQVNQGVLWSAQPGFTVSLTLPSIPGQAGHASPGRLDFDPAAGLTLGNKKYRAVVYVTPTDERGREADAADLQKSVAG
ncbi:hypothetical protein PGTUg99_014249 [Puccinia graminis f. sp. tritici]|uniref:Uncharacterized protein n=1 Tax=Puccinia graminis f. sp. tritici TaxID=56615 RepID=A0A5B0RL96_PUCGR|nr:hypothetical protein PGTUg99_014249 [Puccinia graminis f. sp. tritici]